MNARPCLYPSSLLSPFTFTLHSSSSLPESLTSLAQLIQLSVAPVFLLTGVAGMLSVMANRLARIIERSRVLESQSVAGVADAFVLNEMHILRRRMVMINRAIALCTYSALLVASVIAAIFLGALFEFHLAPVVAGAFVIAMLFLVGGLISFLAEVHLSTRFMRASSRV